jgi:UDP-hydrolysing UDP-N-acetyl-D-glucosamine 2-epimerase
MPLSILAVTGARSDWGLLVPVLGSIRDDRAFDLRLAVTGQHLVAGSPSLEAILADGFSIDHQIDMGIDGDSAEAVTAAMARALAGFGALLASRRPDLLLVLGDRYETLAAVEAALVARVPVAHLCGGDVTEGAIDDAIRHAITKMAHLHFVTNADAARRVAQLGEDPGRIHTVGSPGLDRIAEIEPMSREAFFTAVGLTPRARNLLVTFHPVTLADDTDRQHQAMLDALTSLDEVGLIFTGSNADPGARAIDARTRAFVAARDNAVFFESLGSARYFSALRHVDAVVGNSSSGLYEAPSFEKPTVNIGERQTGRPRAASVIDCPPDTAAITAAIGRAFAMDCTGVSNPYGDGRAAERIVAVLKTIDDPAALLHKSFRDLPA